MNFWDQLLTYLQQKVSPAGFDNWLKGTAFVGMDGDTLFVSTPDPQTRVWLETEYAPLVHTGIRDLGLPVRHVSYESHAPTGQNHQAIATVESNDTDARGAALNPKFTFQSFVV